MTANLSDALKKAAELKKESLGKENLSADPAFEVKTEFFPENNTAVAEEIVANHVDPRVIAYYEGNGKIVEEYRTLLMHIMSLDTVSEIKTLAVTSAHPGEGKTVTALNLGVVMARNFSKQVLIVDCNMRSPSVHRFMGIKAAEGLSNILRDDVPFNVELIQTGVKNLSILPAGMISLNPSQILASPRMENLLKELRDNFDYVILDTPAVMPYADAKILAPLVDGMLLIVKSGRTRREVVQRVESILTGVQSRILGYVLTDVEYHIPEYIHRHL